MTCFTRIFQIPPEVNGVLGMFLGSSHITPHQVIQVFGSLGLSERGVLPLFFCVVMEFLPYERSYQ